jgi:antitoxin component YwqK of YwqJK toxin-antitoxin module
MNQYDENGNRYGPWEDYDSGRLFLKSEYKNGLKHGTTERYYRNGQLDVKYTYKNGRLHGFSESYYDNSELHHKGEFKNAKRVGFWYKNIFNDE